MAKRGAPPPSIYTPELADEILRRLELGETLRSICRDPEMPAIATVVKWLRSPDRAPELVSQYARARQAGIDLVAEEALEIADDESIQADSRRVRLDARKWYAGKMHPEKWGDRTTVDQNVNGNLTVNVTVNGVKARE